MFYGTATAADEVTAYFPKDPYALNQYYTNSPTDTVISTKYFSSGAIDNILPSYLNFQAMEYPISLILQITLVTTSQDQYRWKTAGDAYWSDTTYSLSGSTGNAILTTGASGNIPAANTPTQLYNMASFLLAYPNSPARQDLQYLLLNWVNGPDNQLRLCGTSASTYYLQLGSDGLNDFPECSDRGVCDYTSGICNCFKGYAGIDCTTQNALSAGTGAASTSTTTTTTTSS